MRPPLAEDGRLRCRFLNLSMFDSVTGTRTVTVLIDNFTGFPRRANGTCSYSGYNGTGFCANDDRNFGHAQNFTENSDGPAGSSTSFLAV